LFGAFLSLVLVAKTNSIVKICGFELELDQDQFGK
jgi:hypothetical protein